MSITRTLYLYDTHQFQAPFLELKAFVQHRSLHFLWLGGVLFERSFELSPLLT